MADPTPVEQARDLKLRPGALARRRPPRPAQHARAALGKAMGRPAVHLLALGVAFVAALLYALRSGGLLFDYRGDLYQAGIAILHGRNPYHPGFLAALAASKQAGHVVSTVFALPVYPAPALLAAVPFALLPFLAGGILFQAVLTVAMIAGLVLLGVRDRRCIALALISWPFLLGLDFANVGPLIVLGVGVAWRWRARLWPPALAIAAVVVAKLFPWPLLGWLLVTRRLRTLALALAIGAGALVAGWAVIGFAGFADYPRMVSDLSYVEGGAGASLVSALLAMGVPSGTAEVLSLLAAGAILGLAYRYARRPNGDAQALGLAVIAALVCSPIVWPHYYVLLYVPIALASPRVSPLWFAPLVTVLVPTPAGALEVLVYLTVAALCGWVLCRPGPACNPDSRVVTDGVAPA